MKRPEQQFHLTVADYLDRVLPREVLWLHYPAGMFRTPFEGKMLKRLGQRAGVPDILIICRGKLHGIELKAPKGKLTLEQENMAHWLASAGAAWGLAKSLDDIQALLQKWQIPCHGRLA